MDICASSASIRQGSWGFTQFSLHFLVVHLTACRIQEEAYEEEPSSAAKAAAASLSDALHSLSIGVAGAGGPLRGVPVPQVLQTPATRFSVLAALHRHRVPFSLTALQRSCAQPLL